MAELKFVLKGLCMAILLVTLLQIKVGGETLEIKSDRLIHHSAVGQFLNQAAEGGATLIRKGSQVVGQFVSKSMGKSEKIQKNTAFKIETRHQRVQSEPTDTELATEVE